MTALDDEAWALWGELRDLSSSEFDDLLTIVHTQMGHHLRQSLRAQGALGGAGKLGAFEELTAIRDLPPSVETEKALAIWIDAARQRCGQEFSDRLAARRSALEEPGRDRSLGGVAEKAKVDLRDDLVPIEWLTRAALVSPSVAYLNVPRIIAGARSQQMVGTGFLISEDRRHLVRHDRVAQRQHHAGSGSSRRTAANGVDHHQHRAAAGRQQLIDFFRCARFDDAVAGEVLAHGGEEVFGISHEVEVLLVGLRGTGCGLREFILRPFSRCQISSLASGCASK